MTRDMYVHLSMFAFLSNEYSQCIVMIELQQNKMRRIEEM